MSWCALFLIALLQQSTPGEAKGLVKLGLEALMNVEITSVSKRPERLADAAASVYVINAEDIRRSGATSLPEVLRLAPNLQVARVHSGGYVISARGFNNNAANKLLVLIDGRSVYTPLFAGVFWDVQDLVLDDIERIEVISGPGGTLWGVNAVNGVINIITRPAAATRGTLAAAAAGSDEDHAELRYGGNIGAEGSYRIYAKHSTRAHTTTADDVRKNDSSHQTRAGLRADWERGIDQLTVLGDIYQGREGQPLPGSISITGVKLPLGAITLSGGDLSARWTRHISDQSEIDVRAYYDRTKRTVPPTFAESLDIGDLQFQHSLLIGRSHLAWGAEYRQSRDRLVNSIYFAFLPARLTQRWASLFAEDEVTLSKTLRLVVGARAERNDYTGNEFLPNARLAWKFAPSHLIWAAASRTVRAPSRLDHDAFVPGMPPFLLDGGSEVRSETANVYEIGYRGQPASAISYSLSVFHADYDHLRTQEVAPSKTFLLFANGMKGKTYGLETWVTVQASRRLRLSGGLTALTEHLRLRPGSNDQGAPAAQEGRDPHRSLRFRAAFDVSPQLELDMTWRYVSALSRPPVPAYAAVDVRAGWMPSPAWDLSLTGQNLLGNGHAEFSDRATRTELRRGALLAISRRF
jgi:iron complex outermembrane receptor protein